MSETKYQVITVTENWCGEEDEDQLFGNINYKIYKFNRDRSKGKQRGDGVATLVSKQINSKIILNYTVVYICI